MLEHATLADLERACAENHRELFRYNTKAVGGELHESDGICYYYTKSNGCTIAFPTLSDHNVRARLDDIMNYYRDKQASNIGFWSLKPSSPPDIGIYLLARGFQKGWMPRWMVADFSKNKFISSTIQDVTIAFDDETDVSEVAGLPYGDDNGAVTAALFKKYPGKVQRIIARQNDKIVGHCCLFFGSGDYGVTGIYNVGVIPSMRKQGIGLAIMEEANRYAASQGYRYAILNASNLGRSVYEKAGYRVIGNGMTWWITSDKFHKEPVTPTLTRLAEAVGHGDLELLQLIQKDEPGALLNTVLPNNFSLLQIAVQFRQVAAAHWLVDHGATYTALDAWDLGWHDRAELLLKNEAEEINRRYYEWEGNLLHVAAERNDLRLAQLALEFNVDLDAKDKNHDGTPIGWALFFKRTEIVDLINSSVRGVE